jgi:MtN3 and saliva related transmembrane protein
MTSRLGGNLQLASITGGLATIASTVSFAPQAWRVIKTRDTRDLSAGTYAITVCGFSLWLVYGLMLGAWPLLVSNGVCLLLSAFILAMILLSPAAKQAVADSLDPEME